MGVVFGSSITLVNDLRFLVHEGQVEAVVALKDVHGAARHFLLIIFLFLSNRLINF